VSLDGGPSDLLQLACFEGGQGITRSAARALVDGDAAAAQSLEGVGPEPAADHCLRTSISDQLRGSDAGPRALCGRRIGDYLHQGAIIRVTHEKVRAAPETGIDR
jgi:hypothetical protein